MRFLPTLLPLAAAVALSACGVTPKEGIEITCVRAFPYSENYDRQRRCIDQRNEDLEAIQAYEKQHPKGTPGHEKLEACKVRYPHAYTSYDIPQVKECAGI